jgi:putative heme-binding domain-containing protein
MVAGLFILVWGMVSQSQSQTARTRGRAPASSATLLEGKQIFASSCAGCHGLDGRGGERAPDIATRREMQRLSEVKLARIVDAGVPGTGMPSFRSLGTSGIKSVVSYLRKLQGEGKSATLPGNPQKGESIFFAKGSCSDCHMVGGTGGFLAADLSSYAPTRSVDEIRETITNPDSKQRAAEKIVVVVTRSGESYSGIVRNEDNFSLQLQTVDGTFHFFMKAELQTLKPQTESVLPAGYHSALGGRDLDDVISFLIRSARASKPAALSGEADQ